MRSFGLDIETYSFIRGKGRFTNLIPSRWLNYGKVKDDPFVWFWATVSAEEVKAKKATALAEARARWESRQRQPETKTDEWEPHPTIPGARIRRKVKSEKPYTPPSGPWKPDVWVDGRTGLVEINSDGDCE